MALSTTAIVRIKRRIDDNPLDALVLNCKRFKYDNDYTTNNSIEAGEKVIKEDLTTELKSDCKTIFKFVGTINTEESPLKYIKHSSKKHQNDVKQQSQLKDIVEKLKNEQKDSSKKNRLKIINCYRSQNNEQQLIHDDISSTAVDPTASSTVIVEVESELSTVIKNRQTDNDNYVYDIYFTANNEQFNEDNFTFDLLESIEPLDDIIFNDDKYRDNDDLLMSDDSDSNDENNWRNDYPDDEEFDSMLGNADDNDDVELLNNIIKSKFKINHRDDADDDTVNECRELSSSDDEYYDNDTALKFGKRYAQFKAREKEDYNDDTDNDDDEYGIDRDEYDHSFASDQ